MLDAFPPLCHSAWLKPYSKKFYFVQVLGLADVIFLPWYSFHHCCCPVYSQYSFSPNVAYASTPSCNELLHLQEAENSLLLLACILINRNCLFVLTPLPFLSWGCLWHRDRGYCCLQTVEGTEDGHLWMRSSLGLRNK